MSTKKFGQVAAFLLAMVAVVGLGSSLFLR